MSTPSVPPAGLVPAGQNPPSFLPSQLPEILRRAGKAAVFAAAILPRAQPTLAGLRQAYAAGNASFTDLIDSQRTLLDVRLIIAQARIDREKRLAELEALAGVDIETLAAPTTQPSTQPTTKPIEVH